MIKFTSKAGAAVAMLAGVARQMLRLLGQETQAPSGVITPGQLQAAIAALEAAGRDQADAHRAELAALEQQHERDPDAPSDEWPVSVAQRAFPLVELLRSAHTADTPVLWGV